MKGQIQKVGGKNIIQREYSRTLQQKELNMYDTLCPGKTTCFVFFVACQVKEGITTADANMATTTTNTISSKYY